jgi:hypothetical protein
MLAAVLTIATISLAVAAPPDPYRWCVERSDGATNCYYRTFEQCQAARKTNSAFCRENLFYNPGLDKAPGRRRGR